MMFGPLALAALWLPSTAFAPRHEAEIRIYLADKDKKPLDPTGIEVVLEVAPRKRLVTELVTPKGTARLEIGRGGDVIEAGGLFIEVLVFSPHKSSSGEDGTPYFVPDFAVAPDAPFGATVILNLKGETKTIEGFEFPPLVPRNFAEAVIKLETLTAKLEEWAKARNSEALRGGLPRVTRLCSGIRDLAVEGRKAPVVKACQDIVALLEEVNKALASQGPVVSPALFDRLRVALTALKNP